MFSFEHRVTGNIVDVLSNNHGYYEGDLRHYGRIIFSAPNIHHGYHGLDHMLHVTLVCYRACGYYIQLEKMTKREARNLLIAALFHDYDHPGKPGHDGVNVKVAIEAMTSNLLPEDVDQTLEIASLIRATQFPHVDLGESLTLLQAVIRDADMSQAFEEPWIGTVCAGLGSEFNRTPLEMLKQQLSFLQTLHFSSDFGRVFFGKAAIEALRSKTIALLHILNLE